MQHLFSDAIQALLSERHRQQQAAKWTATADDNTQEQDEVIELRLVHLLLAQFQMQLSTGHTEQAVACVQVTIVCTAAASITHTIQCAHHVPSVTIALRDQRTAAYMHAAEQQARLSKHGVCVVGCTPLKLNVAESTTHKPVLYLGFACRRCLSCTASHLLDLLVAMVLCCACLMPSGHQVHPGWVSQGQLAGLSGVINRL